MTHEAKPDKDRTPNVGEEREDIKQGERNKKNKQGGGGGRDKTNKAILIV